MFLHTTSNQINKFLKQAITYFSIGLVATLIHYSFFIIFLLFTDAVLASFIGMSIGAIAAYIGHKSYTFLTDKNNELKAMRFFLVALTYNLINIILMWILININHAQPFIAQLCTTIILGMIAFIINRNWSYKSKYVY